MAVISRLKEIVAGIEYREIVNTENNEVMLVHGLPVGSSEEKWEEVAQMYAPYNPPPVDEPLPPEDPLDGEPT